MFEEQEIIEFLNRIINSPNINHYKIKNNVKKFYDYLVLTEMCDDIFLSKLNKIIDCLDEIIVIKETFGDISLNDLLLRQTKQKEKNNQLKKRRYKTNYSSFCE